MDNGGQSNYPVPAGPTEKTVIVKTGNPTTSIARAAARAQADLAMPSQKKVHNHPGSRRYVAGRKK